MPHLYQNSKFILIQAEPWWRPGVILDVTLPMSNHLEEHRAVWYLQEVIQTMLDNIVIDAEKNISSSAAKGQDLSPGPQEEAASPQLRNMNQGRFSCLSF